VKGKGCSLSPVDTPTFGLKGLSKTTKDFRVVGVPSRLEPGISEHKSEKSPIEPNCLEGRT